VLKAHVCGLKAAEFIHVLGDTHVYLTHIEALKEQLTRIPRPFPKLKINPHVKVPTDKYCRENHQIIETHKEERGIHLFIQCVLHHSTVNV
jgi:thymidylate synthase